MSSELNFNFDPGANIRPLLALGESLLWSGEPKKGLVLRKSDIFIIPFSLVWFGFACFWEYMVFKSGITLFTILFLAFGSIFVFVGFNFAIGRFFIDTWQRSRTSYGVTGNRIIIVKPSLFSNNNQLIDIKTVMGLNLTEKEDGSGTIMFEVENQLPFIIKSSKTGYNKNLPAFEMIPYVRNVFDIINRQRQKNE